MTIQSSSPWGKNKEMSATCRIQGFVEPESLRQLIRNECPVRRKSPVLQGREKWQHPSCCYNSGNIQNGKEIQAGVFQKCEQLKHMSARWAVHPCHVCSGGSWENPPGPGTIKSLAWPAAKRELLQVHLGTPPHTPLPAGISAVPSTAAPSTRKMNGWRCWTVQPRGPSSFSLSSPFFYQGAPQGSHSSP